MGRLVVIANQKGGVGKTTTAINLAVALAQSKQTNSFLPILLVDLDPQGNATSGLTPPAELGAIKASGKTIYEAIVGRIRVTDAIRKIREKIYLVPSGPDLVGAEVELAAVEGRERCLKEILAPPHSIFLHPDRHAPLARATDPQCYGCSRLDTGSDAM